MWKLKGAQRGLHTTEKTVHEIFKHSQMSVDVTEWLLSAGGWWWMSAASRWFTIYASLLGWVDWMRQHQSRKIKVTLHIDLGFAPQSLESGTLPFATLLFRARSDRYAAGEQQWAGKWSAKRVLPSLSETTSFGRPVRQSLPTESESVCDVSSPDRFGLKRQNWTPHSACNPQSSRRL